MSGPDRSEPRNAAGVVSQAINRRRALSLLGLGGAGALAAACTNTSDSSDSGSKKKTATTGKWDIVSSGAKLPSGKVSLHWVDSGDSKADFFHAFFPEYEKKHSNVDVTYEGVSWNTITQEVGLGLRNGTAADVFELPTNVTAAQAVANNWLHPIDDLVPNWPEVKKRFPAGVFATGVTDFGGKTYGVPFSGPKRIANMLLFNTDLAGKADVDLGSKPITWDAFRQAAKKITKQGAGKYYGIIFGLTQQGGLANPVSQFCEMSGVHGGASGIDWTTGQYNFTNPMVIECAELILGLNCENMYGTGAQSSPLLGYRHSDRVTPGEACSTGSSSISGLAFDTGPNFPDSYRGSLFFSDYSRSCIWVMSPLPDGTPDTSTLRPFATGAIGVVELQFGLDGALYYPDLNDGTIKRIASTNHGPTARASATPTSGRAPLSVAFNGSESSDPDDDALSFAWDLDGDGGFDDSTSPRPTFEYTDPGVYHPRLRVRDAAGDIDFASLTITAGAPPTVSIGRPTSDRHWAVGELVTFAGSAHDFLGARLASSRLSWQLNLRHCSDATTCHTHPLRSWTGVASGSFNGPDHEYPSHLELSLTATDSHGLSATKTVRLDPKIVTLYFRSSPSGLRLSVGDDTLVTPFSKVVILNSVNSVAASSPQYLSGGTYGFGSWSDAGRAAHEIVAHPPPRVFTATYNRR